jgi:apolipoprotein N-acyltransferase
VSGGAAERVRIAGVTPDRETYTAEAAGANAPLAEALRRVGRREALADERRAPFRARAAELADELFAKTDAASATGARIVVWSEGAAMVDARDEETLLARAAETARRRGILLAVSYVRLDTERAKVANVSTLVSPDGARPWRYEKTHPVPGMEACPAGPGVLPTAESRFGRLSTAICFDMAFPALLRQAGKSGASLVLVPSDDWREAQGTQAKLMPFRAVEGGFSVVRATTQGYSQSIDPYGREVRGASWYDAPGRSFLAEVPLAATGTLYARAGDAFGWLCLMGLAALVVLALRERARRLGTI